MTQPLRHIAMAAAAGALVLVPFTADAAKRKTAKAPRSGQYDGVTEQHRNLVLYISGKSVQLAAFSFKCKGAGGRTSLNGIKLVKAKNGYKFALKANGSITFTDDQPDENGKVEIGGRFSLSGKRAFGRFRVRSSRCHTGFVDWKARR